MKIINFEDGDAPGGIAIPQRASVLGIELGRVVRLDPSDKIDRTTESALMRAAGTFGQTIYITQGSFSDHAPSHGTHLGGGVVDIRVTHLKEEEILAQARALWLAGFIVLRRGTCDGMDPHFHAILAVSDLLSPQARDQLARYGPLPGYIDLRGCEESS